MPYKTPLYRLLELIEHRQLTRIMDHYNLGSARNDKERVRIISRSLERNISNLINKSGPFGINEWNDIVQNRIGGNRRKSYESVVEEIEEKLGRENDAASYVEEPDENGEEYRGNEGEERIFSEWVKKARLSKEMTTADLANRSGLSYSVVYKIEAGIIANPRSETIEKLEAALGQPLPKSQENLMNLESSIQGIGRLQDFDPYEENIPNVSCVYVFYDISERPIYVGKTDNLRRRVSQHSDRFWFKQPLVQVGSYVEVQDKVLRNQIEDILIKFLKRNAVLNKQGVVD